MKYGTKSISQMPQSRDHEKTRDQIDGRSLMQSEHIIQQKCRREKMQMEFYQDIISCNLLLVILL